MVETFVFVFPAPNMDNWNIVAAQIFVDNKKSMKYLSTYLSFSLPTALFIFGPSVPNTLPDLQYILKQS